MSNDKIKKFGNETQIMRFSSSFLQKWSKLMRKLIIQRIKSSQIIEILRKCNFMGLISCNTLKNKPNIDFLSYFKFRPINEFLSNYDPVI